MCLALSLMSLTLTLTFLVGFYRKYIEKQNLKLIDFPSLGRNCMFVWSHLTNHCKKKLRNQQTNFNNLTKENYNFSIFSLFHSVKFATRFANRRWHLVPDDGRVGQCLRGLFALLHVRQENGPYNRLT